MTPLIYVTYDSTQIKIFQADFENNFNKLAVRISEGLWFEVYAMQEYSEAPFSNHLEGGLSYPQRTFKGVFNVSECLENSQEFQGYLLLQLQSDRKLETKFVIENSQRFSGFFIDSIINITNMELMAFQGNVKVQIDRDSTLFDLTFHQTNSSENFGQIGHLTNNGHSGRIIYRNNQEEKELYFDVNIFQNIHFHLNYKHDMRTMKLDYMWDRKNDKNKRIYLKTDLQPGHFFGKIQVLQFEGKVNTTFTPSVFRILIEADENYIDMEANVVLDLSEINLLLGIKSSFLSLSDLRTHVLLLNSGVNGKKEIECLVSK